MFQWHPVSCLVVEKMSYERFFILLETREKIRPRTVWKVVGCKSSLNWLTCQPFGNFACEFVWWTDGKSICCNFDIQVICCIHVVSVHPPFREDSYLFLTEESFSASSLLIGSPSREERRDVKLHWDVDHRYASTQKHENWTFNVCWLNMMLIYLILAHSVNHLRPKHVVGMNKFPPVSQGCLFT